MSRFCVDKNCSVRLYLYGTFRKLWEQHVMWTRSFVISTAADLGDLEFVTQRLLRNPHDFADELQKFYGPQIAQRFDELLTAHLTIAAQLVNAAKQGNAAAVEVIRRQWYQNADEIALFLASINPCWSASVWQTMLHQHLKITEDEAVFRLTGRFQQDVALYDEIEKQALEMADMMAEGIIRQFCCG